MPDRAGMPSTGSASMATSWWRKATVNTRPSAKLSSKRPVLPPTGIAAHARNCSTAARVTQAISGAPTRVIGRPACRVADWISKGPGDQVGRIGRHGRRPRVLVAPQQVVGQWQSHPGVEVLQLHRETLRQRNRSARSNRAGASGVQQLQQSRFVARIDGGVDLLLSRGQFHAHGAGGRTFGQRGTRQAAACGCTRPPEAKP